MDDQIIENLRVVYNNEHPSEAAIPKGKYVWKAIQKRLKSKCDEGRLECIMTSLLNKQQAPETWKKNPEEWLSSDDIDAVEKEYMRLIPTYYYQGTVPMDFDKKSDLGKCLVDSLCSLNLKGLYDKGYTQIGIVINTDVSTGKGQHWIAVFCDIRPELDYPRFTYFDSYAHAPEPEIRRLMRRWKEQWDITRIHKKGMKLTFNNTRHQRENSECGMYCLYFHICCLAGISMKDRIPDAVVRSFRGVLFSVGKN
jgi:hypothetical protein